MMTSRAPPRFHHHHQQQNDGLSLSPPQFLAVTDHDVDCFGAAMKRIVNDDDDDDFGSC
jgi:hypothetical protein